MQTRRAWVMVAMAAVLTLAACSKEEKVPSLMNIRSITQGPNEFEILPTKSLTLPTNLSDLPEPTLGGKNLTDPTPKADAIAALGGSLKPANGVPASDSALLNYTGRFGLAPKIRQTLAAEDLEWRQKNDKLFMKVNVYYKAYVGMSLDQQAELWHWRKMGAKTPSAPPSQSNKK
ncbi:MAG: DUF3035 domain-containing protein [Rhodobacteraceae bacterium]|nr:DUF3035 domain-containing protein [Paracoccaceae bacterium]